MTQVNIHHAKTNLSKLLEQVESGEEVIIARAGKPIAKIVGIPKSTEEKPWRPGGGWAGRGWIADDFDEPDPEIEKLFDGPIFPE
ncbi:MAG: type II toxin-antitoxin system Phd/YefM family antitoxin [Candidatus Hydrogenedentota bacterium]